MQTFTLLALVSTQRHVYPYYKLCKTNSVFTLEMFLKAEKYQKNDSVW